MKLEPLKHVPEEEIRLEMRISNYLQINKISNDIVTIRQIIHDASMPFTNDELGQYKCLRESHFKQFKNKIH